MRHEIGTRYCWGEIKSERIERRTNIWYFFRLVCPYAAIIFRSKVMKTLVQFYGGEKGPNLVPSFSPRSEQFYPCLSDACWPYLATRPEVLWEEFFSATLLCRGVSSTTLRLLTGYYIDRLFFWTSDCKTFYGMFADRDASWMLAGVIRSSYHQWRKARRLRGAVACYERVRTNGESCCIAPQFVTFAFCIFRPDALPYADRCHQFFEFLENLERGDCGSTTTSCSQRSHQAFQLH